ncbi:hypothetical protein K470DRAFT_204626, partial [Piedraia hortae CBS 480.64]
HLDGLRGIIVLSSFFWTFFATFIPRIIYPGHNASTGMSVVRIVLSSWAWNASLIASFFFVLSARSICILFLTNPTPISLSGTVIRRIIRMAIAVSIASGLSMAIFAGLGVHYIEKFKERRPNDSLPAPDVPDSALVAFNSMFGIFWVVRSYFWQAANKFWPTNTLWSVSLIFQQSWTVYFLMVVLPYVRPTWHRPYIFMFALGAWWMASWGFYDAAALLLASYMINPVLKKRLEEGVEITEHWKVPVKIPAAGMLLAGLIFKVIWSVWPHYANKELILHPHLDIYENMTLKDFVMDDPLPRLDNFLVIFGLLLVVETTAGAQRVLSARWLTAIGRRSLSIFVAQSLVLWTAGIKLYLHLTENGTSSALANFAVFVVGAITTIAATELYYRAIDRPSQKLAAKAFEWL